jgi:DNA-binding FadR family transcriptional regulator
MATRPTPRVDNPKRAEQIATELEGSILAGRWLPGDRIGNEASLAADHAVSRWTMREAIAILEQAGTVVARRGASGGLFVAAPAADLIRNSLCAYLELSLTPFEAIAETRLALAEASARGTLKRIDNAGRIALSRLVLATDEGGTAAVEAVARARAMVRTTCGNRLIELFLAALSDVGMHSCWMSALDDQAFFTLIDGLTESSRRFALAILADRLDLAMAEERKTLAITAELHGSSAVSGASPSAPNAMERAYAIYPSAHSAKKAERLAWTIRRWISDGALPPGTIIGSEESLMLEHGVGRPVLREAIRILERLGAVEMRRGGASGLTVTRPNPDHIIALARDYFRRLPPSSAERAEANQVLARINPANPVAAMMLAIVAD